jgi:hypothetical protein
LVLAQLGERRFVGMIAKGAFSGHPVIRKVAGAPCSHEVGGQGWFG